MNRLALAALLFTLPWLAGCSSALHSAALRGQYDTVKSELDKGVDVNGRYGGYTPLMAAAAAGHVPTLRLLLERGADPQLRSKFTNKNALEFTDMNLRRIPSPEEKRTTVAILRKAMGLSDAIAPIAPIAAAPGQQPGNLDDGAYGRLRAAANLPPEKREIISDIDAPRGRAAERPDDFALVVGIEEYQNVPKADYGVRDAKAVKRHLEALGFPARNIIALTGSEATSSKLKSYLEEWLPLNVKATSTLFVYYSGHGAPDVKTGDAYLVPWDGDPKFLKSSALPLSKLYSDLGKTKAKRVIVALDACFSGAGGRSVLAKGARPLVAKTADLTASAGNMTVLAAASGDEITGSLDEQGHGMFTYYLLKGLSADPKASADSLFGYVLPRVQDEARRQNRLQTPVMKCATPGAPLLP